MRSKKGYPLLLVILGGLLAWQAGAWGYVFWFALRHESYTFHEECAPVLLTEFVVAIILTCLGIGAIAYGIIKGKEGKDD